MRREALASRRQAGRRIPGSARRPRVEASRSRLSRTFWAKSEPRKRRRRIKSSRASVEQRSRPPGWSRTISTPTPCVCAAARVLQAVFAAAAHDGNASQCCRDSTRSAAAAEEILGRVGRAGPGNQRAPSRRPPERRGGPAARRRSAELVAVEDALQRALMTRVRITGTERAGTIQVAYANAEELERLAELMGARPR